MTHGEQRLYLIKELLNEQRYTGSIEIPSDEDEQRSFLRALFNVRYPGEAGDEFLKIQDEYLKAENELRGVTDADMLIPVLENSDMKDEWLGDVCIWQGDITTLKCDAVVNAANSGMTGCYVPNHRCIDNAIHTFAGVQLRYECAQIMEAQGYKEPTGMAKITKAYNLPCNYVIHTVGPIIHGALTERDEQLLASCYSSCLALADENNLKSIAFCCISTGEFHFPNRRAAEIAIDTVKKYKESKESKIKVIFNVFLDKDSNIYRELLRAH